MGSKMDKHNIEDIYPMSDIARGMIFYSLKDPGRAAYHNQMVYRMIDKAFEPALFKKAFALLVEKHPILRTGFKMFGFDEPLQIVYKKVPLNIESSDISSLSLRRQQGEIKGFMAADRKIPFDFTAADPLWRMKIFTMGNGNILIIWVCHHAIIDGWSSASLVTELNNTYLALKGDPDFVPLKLESSYKDFIIRQVAAKKNPKIIEFWKNQLADYKRFEFPGAGEGGEKKKFERHLDTTLLRQLKKAAVDYNTGLKNLCFAAYIYMLNMLSYDNDIVVGLVTNNRPICPDGDKIIGCFLNTVPVRLKIPGGIRWKDLIHLVTQKLLRLKAYEMLSFFEITRLMGEESREGNPISDTIFNYVDFHIYHDLQGDEAVPMVDDVEFSIDFDDSGATNTLFDFSVDTTRGSFLVSISFSTSVISEGEVKRWYGWFETILDKFIHEPGHLIEKDELIAPREKRKILYTFNDTHSTYPEDKTIYELFEEQAETTPDHIALVGFKEEAGKRRSGEAAKEEDISVTYKELNKRSNRLASWLREKGVQSESIIGITAEGSLEMIAGLLGILKAGGAYLPIDPDYPQERIDYILKDSGTKILSAAEDTGGTERKSPSSFTSLAYIIYTSGSTGRPKGVMVGHRNVVALVKNSNYMAFREGQRLLMTGSPVFDVTTFEIWGSLLNGLGLYLADRDVVLDVEKLKDLIVKHKISVLHLIPQLFNQVVEQCPEMFAGLEYFLVGGDMVRPGPIKRLRNKYKNLKILHAYGPTENTTFSTTFRVDKDYRQRIPIGKPIGNSSVYILDKHGQLQPIGVTGELYAGGDGVARGYLNNPELTAQKFLFRPYSFYRSHMSYKSYLYRTGDLARWLADGNIEFLGRMDHQVKIRGFRVELGEIENRLQGNKDIKEAVAVLGGKGSGHRHILAYVVTERGKKLNGSELKECLLQTLPGYMIPTHFVQLERIPLTGSGKIDRKVLPEPGIKDGERETYAPPRSEVEKKLVEIWTGLLKRENIGIDDNFFAIGGDSIQAIQVAARMNEAGYRIEIRDILQGKPIAQLALLVKKKDRGADQSVITGTVPLTPIQKRFFEGVTPGNRHRFNQAVMLYSREGFTKGEVEELFTKLVEHHDALRMVFAVSGEVIAQENRGIAGKLFDLEVFNFEDIEERNIEKEIQNRAAGILGSIHLEDGPLVKLGLFKTPEGDHLLIVIHHLVVDGISWRILFEDISAGYKKLKQGEKIKFPDKTDSFKCWSGKLSEYASGSVIRELQYWKTVEAQAQKVHGLPGSGALHPPHDIETTAVNLNRQETETLSSNVNHAYNTEINDILLTALGLAVTGWAGGEKVLIDLESHGREAIFAGIDITRTVGWFTGQYPVLLDMGSGEDLSYTIKSVKETLRRIPNKGTGYGILRYLTPDGKKGGYRFQCKPAISFNYLGQWEEENRGGPVQISGIQVGEDVSAGWEQSHALIINGMKAAGELKFVFSYNIHEYDKNSIKELAAGFGSFLRRITAHCSRKEESEFTPSDLGCHKISLDDFSRISESIAARSAGNPQIQSLYPLSPMQGGMLYHALKNKEADAYFVQSVFKLEGQVDRSLLENSVNRLVERYDILRTIFIYEGLEEPLQVVLKERKVQVYYEDIAGLKEEKKTWYIREFMAKDKSRGFDLAQDSLIRLSLFKTGLKSYDLVWSFHHILMDGWCLGIVYKELIEIYRRFKRGRPMELGAVTPYKTYIQWLEKQDKAAGLRYWEKYLEGFEQKTGLPRWEQNDAHRWEEHNLIIDELLTAKIKRTAENHRVTLGTMFQALWGVLLQKYNNCDDVVFGVVVSGRPPEVQGIEQMVGLFINTVPLRIRTPAGQTFSQSLKILRDANISTRSHEYLPLAEIQAQSPLKASLFDHIMVFENYPIHEEVKKIAGAGGTGPPGPDPTMGFTIKDLEIHEQADYDFTIVVIPGGTLSVKFVYNARLYDNEFIKNAARHWQEVLKAAADNPGTPAAKIEIITREEKQRIIFDFNRTTAVDPGDKLLQRLFEEQQEQTPDKIALHGEDVSITYKELNERSRHLARVLYEKGVVPGSIVGITAGRSIEMVAGILGILGAGGAYLPIDPAYPRERIDFMLKDSGAEILLDTKILAPFHWHLHPPPLHAPVTPVTSLAYTIYTSGSTGRPKGVLVQHRNVVRLVRGPNFIDCTADDRLLLTGAPGFDITTFEIWWPLLNGLTLYLPDQGILLDAEKLGNFILKNKISVLHLIPQLFNQVAVQGLEIFKGLSYFLVGGDLVRPRYINLLRNTNPDVKILHMYGPTENTTFSTYFPVDKDYENRIPLGKPISNTCVYVLNKHGGVQPIGAAGELWIGGDGVARGYLNNPELTNKKFLPGGPGGMVFSKRVPPGRRRPKIYNTGDLARWLPDGNLEFFGRLDHQLKIRGIRIELGEIETRLLNHEQVKEAVVIARENVHNGEDRDKYLCAYIVSKGEASPGIPGLKEFLAGRLPNYMIPSYFTLVEKIPLTPTGKVNRRALPAPAPGPGRDYSAPESEIERKLAAIWREVLGGERPPIGIHDNFFQLGGHSLKAMILAAKIHKEFHIDLPVQEVFIRQTIKGLSEYIANAAKKQYVAVEPVEKKEYYALSSAQKRLYFLQQLDIDSTVYNMPLFLPLGKEIERNRLEAVLKQLIHRHESLRTSFERMNEEPVQKIHDEVEFEIEYYDFQVTGNFIRPFDLSRAPLLRSGLIKLADGGHTWMLDIHHIVSDGTSHGVLTEDFMSLYNGEKPGYLRLHYKDFSEWQNRLFASGVIKDQEDYWLRLYPGRIPRLNLPTDYKRPEFFNFRGNNYGFMLEREDAVKFRALSIENGGTLYMNVLAALNTLFYKYTGQTDIIIGSGSAGRRHDDLRRIIGMFVNTLALRCRPAAEKSYKSFFKEVIAHSIKAFENQDVQFDELVDKLNLERDPARNPLFDISLVVQNIEQAAQSGQPPPEVELENIPSKFDMTFFINETGEDVYINIEYYTGIFKETTIKRMASHFKNIIKAVAKDSALKLKDIEIITGKEKRRVLYEFNDTAAEYPRDKTIHELFAVQVRKTPHHIALVHEDEYLTYRRLEQRANRLADYLYFETGDRCEEMVGILMGRSIDRVIALLGVLKSGRAYLPIDPSLPESRVGQIIEDAGPGTVISQERWLPVLNRLQCECKHFHTFLCLDGTDIYWEEEREKNRPTVPVSPGDIAYVIYTSGTTGLSKGVMIEHRNVMRLIKNSNYIDYIDFREGDRYLLTGAFSFDIATFEIWAPLLNGIGLTMVDKEVILDGEKLRGAVVKHRISIIHFIPQLFQQHLENCPGLFETLRLMLIGGDLVGPGAAARLRNKYPRLEILHMYGPTENTTFSTFFPVNKNYQEALPIGKPVSNSTVYILDRWHRPQPVGIFGELCTGGDGVARGYLNNPELTNKKFLPGGPGGMVFSKRVPPGRRGPKIYKTGDMARWLPDGNILFGGRVDHQVKIRGFRVELGEIENRLLTHPSIKDAAVIMGRDEDRTGDRYLCAYIVPCRPGLFDGTELQEYLSHRLPNYMIPPYYVTLEKLPLTPNGKVDRAALPVLAPGIKAGEPYVAPGNTIEKKLVEIWADVLGVDRAVIGIADNFFALGGHSLKATILVSRIYTELGVKIPLAEIFKTPFIRGLASRIHKAGQNEFPDMESVEKKEYYELSYNQKRLWVIHCMNPNSSSYHMPGLIHLGHEVNIDALEKAFSGIFERHESFRTGFAEIHGQPVQFIRETVEIPFRVMDISGRGDAEKQRETREIMHRTTARPFDLQSPPLFRSVLIKQDNENCVLVYNMHHIISDGWSMEIVKSEFARIYTGHLEGNESHPGPLRYRYRDFARWHNRQARDPGAGERAHRYWKKKLTAGLPVLELNHHYRPGYTGKRAPTTGTEGDWDKGGRYRCAANPTVKKRIFQMAGENRTTPFMVLFTMYNLLMAYLSGQDHIVSAVINAGRQHVSLHPIVGYFVYPLFIETRVNIDEDFEDLLSVTNREVSEAFQHQAYPFEMVLEDMKMGFPEVSIAFNMLNIQNISPGMELDSFESYHMESTLDVKFDIVLFVMEYKNGIDFFWDYRNTLFSPKTIEGIARNYLELMEDLAGNDDGEEEAG